MSRALIVSLLLVAPAFGQNPREQKVRDDKKKVEAAGYWRYNDVPGALAEAKKTGKPVVVVLRCLPCEECVKLDDDLVNSDPVLRPLLDQFVRVRVVGTNGLDLSLFQFDTDQSFAVFLLNGDGTIYGRFGTRSHRTNWVGDVSIKGLAAALKGALDLHAKFDAVKGSLAAKRGPKPEVPTPEQFPTHVGKFGKEIDYAGTNAVKSCIHCHQIGEARHAYYRKTTGSIPEELLFPYPHPKSVGLTLDPNERAKILEVADGSAAAAGGIIAGDTILSLAGQPLLSIADVQWVLHNTPADGKTVLATVTRGTPAVTLTLPLTLAPGWRRAGDLSWRSSTWGLRRMATGGMVLEELDGKLSVKNVGQFGAHAAAKNAGVQKGDVLVSFDGKEFRREADLLLHALTAKKTGEKVPVVVNRNGQAKTVSLPIQE
jgi:serine protease Do